tara:strand:- start:4429 stop:5973 length:1545 start_codon:yes stop_codon:yes gene_type:complete
MRPVNVTPKPGFQFNDNGTDIVRSTVVPFRGADSLTNALSGMGTTNDPRRLNRYCPTVMTQESVAAAYRGSGLMRKIINIPAADMVREWREWSGEEELIEKLAEEEKRLLIRQKVKQAEILRGLGGGAFILGLPGDLSQPVPTTIGSGTLAYVHVVSRWQLSYRRLIDDMNDPRHGEPEMWMANTATGQQMIHPDRIITFRADPIPAILPTGEDQYWGESRVAQVLDAVEDCDTARQAFAALITKARLIRIGIPNLSSIVSTSEGETAFRARMAAFSTAESIFNATVYDSGNGEVGEEIGDTTYKFEGMKDVMDAYGEWASAIADIPATRLLGRAPEGLNSSGDSQQADWNRMVMARQSLDLGPCLDQLDRFLIPSATGKPAGELNYEFTPLDMPTEKERADRFKTQMEAAKLAQDMGSIPDQAFAEALQSILLAEKYLPGLKSALEKIPDDVRFGIEQERDETDPSTLQATGEEVIASTGERGRTPNRTAPPRRAANDSRDAIAGDFGLPETD